MSISKNLDINDTGITSVYDDLSLWAAPFGLTLLETINIKRNMKVLDIGPGTGFPILEVAERLGESSIVYGIDPWEAAIERTKFKMKKRNVKNVEIIVGVAEELPFDNEYFDLIISNNGINNVSDLDKTLSECNRVSKTGSQFITTFNLPDTMKEFYDIYKDVLEKRNMINEVEKLNEHIYKKRKSLEYMCNKYLDSGFEIIDTKLDQFTMKFIDAKSMLNHFFIRLCFLDNWRNVVNKEEQENIFSEIEKEIDMVASEKGEFVLTIPYATIKAIKK